MSPDLEHGFGTGLRAQLRLKQGDAAEPAPEVTAPPEPEQHEQAPAPAEAEIGALRAELEEALNREQQLRDALQHHVEAHERELAAGRDLALQEAEVQQDTAKLAERETDLDERERVVHDLHERVADERRELNLRRTELLAEEARIVELGLHTDGRTAEIDAASIGRENTAAELARQLAEHAERERALNIARAEASAREEAIRVREEAAGARERDLLTAESEVERVRARLQERVTAIASRESDTTPAWPHASRASPTGRLHSPRGRSVSARRPIASSESAPATAARRRRPSRCWPSSSSARRRSNCARPT